MSIQIQFGVGNLVLTRTDIANATPTKLGVIQDVEIDFDFTNKMLIGQLQFPVDVARGEGKITGKAKIANLIARTLNDSFFGGTLGAGTGGTLYQNNEAHTVPAPSGPYTITIAPPNSGVFLADQGVVYAATGLPLVNVASGPTVGQYSFVQSTGVYTFAAADDTASILISYTYTVTTGASLVTVNNQLMGVSPVFSMLLAGLYKGNVFNLVLPAAISTKLSFPFKNTDYSISDFEFSAYANAAGNVANFTMSQ